MYLLKDLKTRSKWPEIDLSDYILKFSFVPYLYPERRSTFKEKSKKYTSNLSDIAAAVVTRVLTQGANYKLINEAMSCCLSILQSKGYETISEKELHKMVISSEDLSEKVIAVLGCQTKDLLQSRVNAAIELINVLRTDMKLFFSGSAPGHPSKIPNESKAMLHYFQSVAKRFIPKELRDSITARPVYLESTSTNTMENIKNVLTELERFNSKDIYLFIVSSNFHLARVDLAFSSITDHPMYDQIGKFFLCGSEDLYTLSSVAKKDRYIKQLFFGIYDNLMHHDLFYQFQSEYQ